MYPPASGPKYAPVRFRLVALLLVFSLLALAVPTQFIPIIPTAEAAPSTTIVISQVYGGAGCGTANCSTYKNDFIELYNRGTSPVILNGWSVQYASSSGTSWQVTPLTNVTLQPGRYYLVQEGAGANGISAIPTPDAPGSIPMSATAGKVALVSSTTPLTGSCPLSSVVDFVGYGGANCAEGGSPTAQPSTTTAAIRKNNGATDTDVNSADFSILTPAPRNCSTVGGQPCTAPINLSATTGANPASVGAGDSTLLTVTVTPGANPASDGIAVSANLSAIGGSATQQFLDNGLNGDAAANDNVFSYTATIPNSTGGGSKNLPVSVSDAQGRAISATIALNILAPTAISATGAAAPATLQVGQSSLLTVAVMPGTNPASAGITVTGNLSAIGGSAAQQFYDDGTNGDAVAGDKTYSFNATVGAATTFGTKTLPVTVADNYPRTANVNITLTVKRAPATPGSVVISQVYGGGGNSGATLRNDFIELFNRSAAPVDLEGWSVQYASAGGGASATWTRKTNLTGVIQPGQYFLIQEAAGTGGTTDLPTPDLVANSTTGIITIGAEDGKVALVSDTDALPNGCPVGNPYVVDFIGYGSADCFEGTAAAPRLGNTTAALRTRNGCRDTDINSLNFIEGPPAPRNSATTPNTCQATDLAPEVIKTNPASGGTNVPVASNITVEFDASVSVADGGITVSCATSGPHTVAVTGGPNSFTVNPDTDFLPGEQCTATVLASHVSTLSSPPVSMTADYSWTFVTLIVRDPAEHLVMGNPSGAVADPAARLNYLMMKPQYALSYNDDRGISNWTSWHLDSTWTTSVADRQNDFRPDETLPAGFKRVTSGYRFADFGFQRGHLVASADRTSSVEDNSATFLMTNIMPQAPGNNEGPWADLEIYLRTLLGGASNELYIVAGGHGSGGTSPAGSFESITDTGGNVVAVPDVTWKVVMVMPRAGGDDLTRVNASTRTFAVIMPNDDNIRNDDWKKYLATVDQVEALTGFDFFSNVPDEAEAVIEARLDGEYNTAPVADAQSVSTAEDTQKAVTLTASDFNVNKVLSYEVVGGPSHGTLSGDAPNLTYTPHADYSGPDSFTFKVNDGGKDSNVATVSINVTPVNDAPVLSGVPASAAVDELKQFLFTASAADVDSSTLTFSLVGAPAGAAIDATSGQFTWTPTEAQGGTGSPFVFAVRVSDGTEDVDSSVTVTVSEVNSAPALAPVGNKVVSLGGTLSFNASGTDADVPAQTLTYSLTGAHPAGASINPATGAFSWTPTAAQAGQTYTFGVRVTDDGPGPLYDEEVITVGAAYTWSGFLQPVNADGSSVFKLGRTVPVKFQLTGASAGVTNAVARLYVVKVTDGVLGTEEEADSTSNATEGNLFRYSDGQYVFNLGTAGLSAGTYQLRVDTGDGVQRVVQISLR